MLGAHKNERSTLEAPYAVSLQLVAGACLGVCAANCKPGSSCVQAVDTLDMIGERLATERHSKPLPSTYRRRSPFDRPPPGRRATGIALAVAINLAMLIALLGIQASKRIPTSFTDRLVVDLMPDSPPPAEKSEKVPETAAPRPTPPRIPRVNPPPAIEVPRKLDMIELTREEYAANDLSKVPRSASADSGAGTSAGDSEAVGRGPSGQILYAAEWWRRPTDAEVSGYLPANAPEGYGLIACRTVADHRVEDCVELENFPRGSRLAGAVRQAAWQFRVRPPRINGREMVGEWVRIRIDYRHIQRDRD